MNKSNYNLTKINNGLKALNISSTDDQIDRLVRFYEMVVETNKVMNLTSITDWDEFVDKHFLDSLVLESVFPEVKDVNKAIDIGTGAGFPGIPLAIMYPNIEFTLLDTLTITSLMKLFLLLIWKMLIQSTVVPKNTGRMRYIEKSMTYVLLVQWQKLMYCLSLQFPLLRKTER